ncbi:DUF951 domain-containing protein [Desulfuribacillus stibiiarsenatis]|uniref:DUF951 domain-containing protein n=1 Tax=Desulfuribacillus stibiiarsenatis TaxID=1390249 RepID=A0A1E5L985_9FIRM|nr:DUF951 domain-containing protein [Desulfuribacillus stibiiarsenatis]OEH86503.1 DUF951 domain-containing protein [Desulfuribacillus stibiiarsenatis]
MTGIPNIEYGLNDVVELKKGHPCGANEWKIIRLGMDIRVKCENCNRSVLIPRNKFNRRIKKILMKGNPNESAE